MITDINRNTTIVVESTKLIGELLDRVLQFNDYNYDNHIFKVYFEDKSKMDFHFTGYKKQCVNYMINMINTLLENQEVA